METTLTTESMECLICTELPIKVTETDCCGAIICEEWGPKLKECPNRCTTTGIDFVLNVNKFVQRMINHIKVKCKYCQQEVSRSEALDHQENCEQNNLRPVVMNHALHPWVLYMQEKSNSWFCDGLKIIKGGCALTGTSKAVTDKSSSWYWTRCDADFCEAWIQKHAKNKSFDDLRQFTKQDNMHLSHPHPLALYFGTNLPEAARK